MIYLISWGFSYLCTFFEALLNKRALGSGLLYQYDLPIEVWIVARKFDETCCYNFSLNMNLISMNNVDYNI